jgi:hypothetical protein
MSKLDQEIEALGYPLPSQDDPDRVTKLLTEYSQRMGYQGHLIDRQWKVVTLYLIIYGLLFTAIRVDNTERTDMLAVSGITWLIALIILATLVNQRHRRVLNAARLKIVANELGLVGITHYSPQIHTVFNLHTESFWVFLFIAISPAFTTIYAILHFN